MISREVHSRRWLLLLFVYAYPPGFSICTKLCNACHISFNICFLYPFNIFRYTIKIISLLTYLCSLCAIGWNIQLFCGPNLRSEFVNIFSTLFEQRLTYWRSHRSVSPDALETIEPPPLCCSKSCNAGILTITSSWGCSESRFMGIAEVVVD